LAQERGPHGASVPGAAFAFGGGGFSDRESVRLASRLPARARRRLRVVVRLDDTLVEKPKDNALPGER
jgi:hypothetical protein